MVTGDGEDAVFVEKDEGSASGSLGSAGRLAEFPRGSHGGQGGSAMAGGEEIMASSEITCGGAGAALVARAVAAV